MLDNGLIHSGETGFFLLLKALEWYAVKHNKLLADRFGHDTSAVTFFHYIVLICKNHKIFS